MSSKSASGSSTGTYSSSAGSSTTSGGSNVSGNGGSTGNLIQCAHCKMWTGTRVGHNCQPNDPNKGKVGAWAWAWAAGAPDSHVWR